MDDFDGNLRSCIVVKMSPRKEEVSIAMSRKLTLCSHIKKSTLKRKLNCQHSEISGSPSKSLSDSASTFSSSGRSRIRVKDIGEGTNEVSAAAAAVAEAVFDWLSLPIFLLFEGGGEMRSDSTGSATVPIMAGRLYATMILHVSCQMRAAER